MRDCVLSAGGLCFATSDNCTAILLAAEYYGRETHPSWHFMDLVLVPDGLNLRLPVMCPVSLAVDGALSTSFQEMGFLKQL